MDKAIFLPGDSFSDRDLLEDPEVAEIIDNGRKLTGPNMRGAKKKDVKSDVIESGCTNEDKRKNSIHRK